MSELYVNLDIYTFCGDMFTFTYKYRKIYIKTIFNTSLNYIIHLMQALQKYINGNTLVIKKNDKTITD